MAQMQQLELGDIVVANIPITDFTGIKVRPMLVLKNTGDTDLILARITSNLLNTPYDFIVEDWMQANLNKPSVVRLHKIVTVNDSVILQAIGKLTKKDLSRLEINLDTFWKK